MIRSTCVIFVSLLLLCSHPMTAAAQGLLERGIAEYRAENYEEAQELFSGALKADPGSAAAYYYQGLTLKRMGNLKAAIPFFKAALKQAQPEKAACLELADIYFALDEYREAYSWLDLAEKNGSKAGDVAFLRGMIMMREKRFDDAIGQFGKAKSTDPALAPSADFQIAMAHASERRLEQARASLKTVIKISPDSDMAEYARDYEKTFANMLEKHRTWRASLYAGYVYDDNVILKPRNGVSGLSFPRESDNGFVGNLRLDYTPMLEGNKLFSAQYAANTNTYGERGTHNQIVQNISLVPGLGVGNGAVTLPLTYSHSMLAEEGYAQTASVRPTWYHQLAPGHITQFSLGYARREMLKKAFAPEENRDSNIFSGSVAYLKTFAEGKGLASLRYEMSDDVAEGANWHNLGNRVTLLLLAPLWKKVSANLSGDVFFQKYNNNTFFDVRRNDTIWTGTAGITWEFMPDIKLNVQYVHTRAESNIFIYDYVRNTIQTGIEFNF